MSTQDDSIPAETPQHGKTDAVRVGSRETVLPFRDYAAMQFYRMDRISRNTLPIRWGVLREDLKEKYLAQADLQVKAWADDEEAARKRRGELSPLSSQNVADVGRAGDDHSKATQP